MKPVLTKTRIFVGNSNDCAAGKREGMHIVHACKFPCYMDTMKRLGALVAPSRPHYYSVSTAGRAARSGKTQPSDIYLNMIDPDRPLFNIRMFEDVLDFLRWITSKPDSNSILVHCNEGLSRAPTIALLVCAKIDGTISNTSYGQARLDFPDVYPGFYEPRPGIELWMAEHWKDIK